MIRIQRVYGFNKGRNDYAVLVDRLWPRGLAKDSLGIDEWIKEISPSNELRKWYGHDPKKWNEFKKKYFEELKGKERMLKEFAAKLEKNDLVLVFASKEEKLNNAVALKELIESRFT